MRKRFDDQAALEAAIARQVKAMSLGQNNSADLRRKIQRLITSILEEQGPLFHTTVLVAIEGGKGDGTLRVQARMRVEELGQTTESRLSVAKVIPIKRGGAR